MSSRDQASTDPPDVQGGTLATGAVRVHSIRIAVENSPIDGRPQLTVTSANVDESAPFDVEAADQICRAFNDVMQFEHGVADPSQRHDHQTLATVESRFRREILKGKTGVALDDECRREGYNKEVWIKGLPSHLNLPWELLRSWNQNLFDMNDVAVARSIPAEGPSLPLVSQSDEVGEGGLRVLFAPAEPAGLGVVHWREALDELDQRLWFYRELGLARWEVLGEAAAPDSLARLRRHISDRQYDVVYLLAHGRVAGEPQVALVGRDGEPRWTSVHDLVPTLTRGGKPPRMVVLGCCHLSRVVEYGGVARQLIESGVPAVLSMQSTVSTRGAAVVAATLLRSILRGQSLGRAVLECRRALSGHESVLPTLWLNPHWKQHEPLVRIRRLSSRDLVSQARDARGRGDVEARAEQMLAKLCYVEDVDGFGDSGEIQLKRTYVHQIVNMVLPRIRRYLDQSVEEVAQLICWLEDRCPDFVRDNDELKGAKKRVNAEMLSDVREVAAAESEHRWQEAVSVCDRAISRQTPSFHVERICRDSQTRLRAHRHYCRANALLAEARQEQDAGRWVTATQLKRSALAHFNYATREADREFHWIAPRIEQLQAEVAAEQLVNDARDAMLGFHWETAASKMREAAKIRPAGFPGDRQDEGLIKYCQDIELQVASAHDLATGGRWDEALESIRDITPESLVPRTNGRQDDESRRWRNELLTSWSRHLNLDQVRGIWRRASQAYNHLHTLAGGAAVDAAGAPADVRAVLRVSPVDAAAIESARRGMRREMPSDLPGWLADQLKLDAPCFFALEADWPAARKSLFRLCAQGHDVAPAYHRLAVMAMARGLDGQKPGGDPRAAAQAWCECLQAWAEVLASYEYWQRLPQSPDGSPLELRRIHRLLADLRKYLAQCLGCRDDGLERLRTAGEGRYVSPQGHRQLVLMTLELAGLKIEASDWGAVRTCWEMALSRSNDADAFEETCRAVFDAAVDSALAWDGEGGLDKQQELWNVAVQCLSGTPLHQIALRALADTYIRLGATFLPQCYGEGPKVAHRYFEKAHQLAANDASCVGLLLGLIACAGLEDEFPEEQVRLHMAAKDLAQRAWRKWPHSRQLIDLQEILAFPEPWGTVGFEEFVAEYSSNPITVVDDVVIGLRNRGAHLLHEGRAAAVFYLVNACWMGAGELEPLVVDAVRRMVTPPFSGAVCPESVEEIGRWIARACRLMKHNTELARWHMQWRRDWFPD